MNFQTIDLDTWYRKSYFDHYMKEAKCSFSITTNVNVTNLLAVLKKKKIKLYPVLFISYQGPFIRVLSLEQLLTTKDSWDIGNKCTRAIRFFIRTTKRFPPSGQNTQMISRGFIVNIFRMPSALETKGLMG